MKTPVLLVAVAVLVCSVSSVFADAALRSGDSFDLRMGGVPSDDQATLSSNYTIDGDGYLNLAYIGRIHVGGLTASQIQSLIERTFVSEGIFTHPSVSLTIASTARFVNVGGQVKSPGRVPYTADMTVFSTINAAGDFTEFADRGKVRLMRGNNVQIINCKKIQKDPSLDIKVLPGDIIQVPESMF